MARLASLCATLPVLAVCQQPYYPPGFPPTPILPSSYSYAPSVTPNVMDKTAPDAQTVFPGYKASNIVDNAKGVTADLMLKGPPCSAYGNDIQELSLEVQYQSDQRLAVRIFPKHLTAENSSQYIIPKDYTPLSSQDSGANKDKSDLKFEWSNEPSFQFKVIRKSSNDVLFNTLAIRSYGLAAYIHSFRLGNNFTQAFWNVYNLDNDQTIDSNSHDTHPMYLETRYANGTSASHGVYARNAHGQDWLLQNDKLKYRTIGGSFDLYFLSGPTPSKASIKRAGPNQNWTNLQEVIDLYAAQNIQLESVMCDLDYMKMNRDFTLSPGHYDLEPGREFLARLHANGQHWLPILNPNIYAPNPANASDAYPTYDRGKELDVYIKNKDGGIYYGDMWPGFSAYVDFISPHAQQFWTNEFQEYYKQVEFDGFWLDISDPTSFCTGSCGTGRLNMNPIHVPFALPGDPDTALAVDYRYPEGFEITNATEGASASAAAASQSAAYPTPLVTPTPTVGRTIATPGVRNLTFPPYAINNFLPGHSLVKSVVSPDALHADGSTEHELHNLYGHLSGRVSYNALTTLYNGKRPFYISRSTFAGSGTFGNMYFGIAEALQMSIAGIPYFGVETCGFNGNLDMELCTRWMQLSAWYPFYRNHNDIPQEAYIWATTAESTRRIMNIRYSLLPYTYTLFHKANTAGETVLRALAWEFPNDPSLAAATTVKGVFPGVAEDTIWYDWYNLSKVEVAAGENKTLDAPLLHQPIHIRGGHIVPTQKPGNTTSTSRKNPWSLIVALDKDSKASGELFIDDGISITQEATKNVNLHFQHNVLSAKVKGHYQDGNALANVTIAGISSEPKSILVNCNGKKSSKDVKWDLQGEALYITGLGSATKGGVWSNDLTITLQN
ncbi:Putative glycoside hydrolase family 31, galactose mutarotase-like domain superfamily [Septoria linicola]|uniref:alpha-glucosidase n=1 Tax=Septoria linicola TaxID=215465 RepID=A0A9Q9AJL0_9PEZI|nr:Putative glycoside hydrolase family 31, galactose mutarotase-like domain superfamily [Septoria linicola]